MNQFRESLKLNIHGYSFLKYRKFARPFPCNQIIQVKYNFSTVNNNNSLKSFEAAGAYITKCNVRTRTLVNKNASSYLTSLFQSTVVKHFEQRHTREDQMECIFLRSTVADLAVCYNEKGSCQWDSFQRFAKKIHFSLLNALRNSYQVLCIYIALLQQN